MVEAFTDRSGTVIALAVASKPRRAGLPPTLELPRRGLPKPSWVKISQVRTLTVERLGRRIIRLPPEWATRAVEGLAEIVG